MQDNVLTKKSRKIPLSLLYTITFIFICLLTYSLPWLAGKTLIWDVDGIAQHFPILAQFQRILQGTAHQSLFGWSWNLGVGADQLTTFAFYIVGDPFSYLIALFPADKLELGYQILILLRLYCAGLAFLGWANQRSFSRHSKLIGTLIYTFAGFNYYVSMHHPFFLLPMIIFPLLAMGVEKVLHQQNWLPLALATALALISNFYFAYMLALGTLVYLITRWLHYRRVASEKLPGGRIIYCLVQAIVTGLIMAGITLFPTLIAVFNSTRVAYHAKFANGLLLYPAKYYLALPNQFISSTTVKDYWLIFNLCGLAFLAAVYVLKHFKANRSLAIILVVILVSMLLPQISATTNAFTTPSNRWLFLAVLPMSLAVMVFVDQIPNLTRSDLRWLIGISVGLIGLVWLTKGFTLNIPQNDLIAYGFLMGFLLLIACQASLKLSVKTVATVLTGLVLVNLVSNGQGWLSPNNSRNLNAQLGVGAASKWVKDYYDGAEKALPNKGGFYRTATMNNYYQHRTAGNNIPMLLGTHDLGAYYSIQNGYVLKFSRSLGNADSVVNSVIGEADGRTTLLNLLGVQYLFAKTDIVKHPQDVPYGYHFVKNRRGGILDFPELPVPGLSNHSGTVLLKSNFALPLVYMQNHVITAADYRSLSPLQCEQALLTGATVEKPIDGLSAVSPKPTIKNVGYITQLYDQHLVNNPIKATLYRMRHSPNSRYRQAAAKFKTNLPANKVAIWEKATGLNPNGQGLRNVINQNREVVERHQAENQAGLKIMDNDAQGHHLAYRLKLKDPQKYRHCELYLVIDGITETRHTLMDRLNNLRADSIVSGTPVSKLQKINRLRTAAAYPDLGGYSITVQTGTNSAWARQLPINNLSDYEDRQHIVLNLGYSAKARRALTVRFRGVKQLHFKRLRIMAVPFNKRYNQRINQLQQTGLQYQKVTNDSVSGYTDLTNHPRLMTTSIPYSTGWRLKIDGQAAETFRVNSGFIGAKIPEGRHFIKLTYQTPGFNVGIILSIIGIAWWLIFLLLHGIRLLRKFISR
ncbi:YfhO family protein [Lentilactobacillus farraginis]|uniref:Glycosyltransferase n=1 Tax=Lentilactobacillus farraginis DSM 18382 = JCM 14108 TaxID=1423743 RepID=X0PK91_9LACO|nr:YfhO family protein [Lentilactobacillus farraginis]KRM12862.1 glycosyltransferase [Lentilactobacillus farraginis DSM 18382 = JCM 14108]GAF37046.1 hypothetical protein JCM14108_2047 [Lentilactobacillus farraginis DSM 18382 = JCM 14108]